MFAEMPFVNPWETLDVYIPILLKSIVFPVNVFVGAGVYTGAISPLAANTELLVAPYLLESITRIPLIFPVESTADILANPPPYISIGVSCSYPAVPSLIFILTICWCA